DLRRGDALGSARGDDPVALGVAAGSALMVTLDLFGGSGSGVSALRGGEDFAGGDALAGGVEKVRMNLRGGCEGVGELGRRLSKMNEAGDGDGESPTARAQVDHAVALENSGARDGVLVAVNAVVDAHEQHGGCNAAREQRRRGARCHLLLANARREAFENFDGGGGGVARDCAEAVNFAWQKRRLQIGQADP